MTSQTVRTGKDKVSSKEKSSYNPTISSILNNAHIKTSNALHLYFWTVKICSAAISDLCIFTYLVLSTYAILSFLHTIKYYFKKSF